jgi:hypothetical protein
MRVCGRFLLHKNPILGPLQPTVYAVPRIFVERFSRLLVLLTLLRLTEAHWRDNPVDVDSPNEPLSHVTASDL